jgi:Bacteriophage probable baseplate hub protein
VSVIPLYEQDQPFYAPAFEVRFSRGGGQNQPLPEDVVRDVMEVTFHDSIDTVDTFTLTLNNWDATSRELLFIGSGNRSQLELLQPGNTIQLLMGYQGRSPDSAS